jgi:3-phosphoshikimate 1-carboxyvinyltransferase
VNQLELQPARRVQGFVRVPGDKSISHRYVLLGAIARGTTAIEGLSHGADVQATVLCVRGLGVHVDVSPELVCVRGHGWDGLCQASHPLDAANSGTTTRLLAGILATRPFRTVVTGDESLSRRPMQRVIDPLTAMGAAIASNNGRLPLTIDGGPLRPVSWRTPVPSAQVKSAILFAGLRAEGTTRVEEPAPTRDHTERAFPAFGLHLKTAGTVSEVTGGQEPEAPRHRLVVPGDPSSAAVWAAAAAALPGSNVVVDDVALNPRRLGFIRALERSGADVRVEQTAESGGEPVGRITIRHGSHHDTVIGPAEVPDLIDELPVLAGRAALGGRLEVSGAAELRVKESDRITALVTGLRALGVDADERPDGFIISGTRRPTGGRVDAAHDHRLVMAFAIVALGASGPTVISGADVVSVSYPTFERDLAGLIA